MSECFSCLETTPSTRGRVLRVGELSALTFGSYCSECWADFDSKGWIGSLVIVDQDRYEDLVASSASAEEEQERFHEIQEKLELS